jgi:hypothetical protein
MVLQRGGGTWEGGKGESGLHCWGALQFGKREVAASSIHLLVNRIEK